MREFNLRERAEIVAMAQAAANTLSAQELIDYFTTKLDDNNQNYPIVHCEYYMNFQGRNFCCNHKVKCFGKCKDYKLDEEVRKLAWYLYCKQTAGGADVRDFWEELSVDVQNIFIDKVVNENF